MLALLQKKVLCLCPKKVHPQSNPLHLSRSLSRSHPPPSELADDPRPELTYDDVIFNRGSIFASNGDLEDAAKSIINYILWDGRVVESEGAEPFLPEYEDGARYVIVLEPTTDIAAVYNSFLAFEIDHSEDNLADWAQFWELYRELTEDPVDLLTGSF